MADLLPTRDERGRLPTDVDLDRLQRTTLLHYLHETNPDNGLVRDKPDPAAPCSIAAVGICMGRCSYQPGKKATTSIRPAGPRSWRRDSLPFFHAAFSALAQLS